MRKNIQIGFALHVELNMVAMIAESPRGIAGNVMFAKKKQLSQSLEILDI